MPGSLDAPVFEEPVFEEPVFEELLAEAAAVDVSGWDFSWLEGRATEERPPWGYQKLMGERIAAFFHGPGPRGAVDRDPGLARTEAERAGLEVADLRTAELKMEFFDVGAMVYFLRKVVWFAPDFTVEKYRDRLKALHEKIQSDGPFTACSRRFLIEARKPLRP